MRTNLVATLLAATLLTGAPTLLRAQQAAAGTDASLARPSEAVAAADSAGIVRAALDYLEGWYAGDAERMERVLHPDLAKRIVHPDAQGGRDVLDHMTAAQLVESTRRGGGRGSPADRQRKDVRILDAFENAAVVRVDASDWVDYMQLGRVNGEWKIINVLWALRPEAS